MDASNWRGGRLAWVTGLLAATLGTAGCATTNTFDARVTAFHKLPATPEDRTYSFAPSASQKDSLEYRSYEDVMRGALLVRGFREAQPARYRVAFDWTVQDGSRNVTRSAPVFSPSIGLGYGSFGGFGGGWGGVGMRFGYPYYPYGWGGWPGYVNVPSVERVVEHRLRVQIDDTQGGATTRVWEGSASADASAANMAAVFPLLSQAIFADFPGPTGQTRLVKLEVPKQ